MPQIPDSTIKRLALYYRTLKTLQIIGVTNISSRTLGELLALTPAQVRKDLSYFGSFGKRGEGYDINTLIDQLSDILGINKEKRVCILGAGNLGSALASYKGFSDFGFNIVALFDIDKKKIGKQIGSIPCYHIKNLPNIAKQKKINIAIIAVPPDTAQGVADLVVNSGITAILNFAPVKLILPNQVKAINVDLALELKSLGYYLSQKEKNSEKKSKY